MRQLDVLVEVPGTGSGRPRTFVEPVEGFVLGPGLLLEVLDLVVALLPSW